MKSGFTLAVLVAVVALCRLNLPPNQVSSDLYEDAYTEDSENEIERFVRIQAAKVMTSEAVADWDYSDFGVFKVATSERLGVVAMGFPFCRWILMSDPEDDCGASGGVE